MTFNDFCRTHAFDRDACAFAHSVGWWTGDAGGGKGVPFILYLDATIEKNQCRRTVWQWHCERGIHERSDRCVSTHARAPLDTLDIGQPWSRWPGEPNFENGKLVCPVSTFIRSFGLPSFLPRCAPVVGSPCGRLDPKRGGRQETGGDRSGGHFFDSGSSRSVLIGHTTLVIVIHDFSRRSVARSCHEKCDFFGFFADLQKGVLHDSDMCSRETYRLLPRNDAKLVLEWNKNI